jgi:acetylglutamate kinase
VNTVHIIDGRVPHALLLEILTDQAFGNHDPQPLARRLP